MTNLSSAGDYITIKGLSAQCIIGIFDWERVTPQTVVIDLDIPCDTKRAAKTDCIEDATDYKKVAKAVLAFTRDSRFYLLETLGEKLAELCLSSFDIPEVRIRLCKPGALRGAENVGIAFTRSRRDIDAPSAHTSFLSLGSNILPEIHVKEAVRMLARAVKLVKLSGVYRTAPYGVSGQNDFWNMAIQIETHKSRDELKRVLNEIEEAAGRSRDQDRSGPRTLDLDIVYFDGRRRGERLNIGETENETKLEDQGFVLVPLAEIAPTLVDADTGMTVLEMLSARVYAEQPLKYLGTWPVAHPFAQPAAT